MGAKATQFHLQRNGTWSIPHISYPSSDIRPWLGLKYQLFLRPVCVRAPIVPSPDCQGLADKDYIIWLLSKQLELFPLRSVLQSLDIRYWDLIFFFQPHKVEKISKLALHQYHYPIGLQLGSEFEARDSSRWSITGKCGVSRNQFTKCSIAIWSMRWPVDWSQNRFFSPAVLAQFLRIGCSKQSPF